MDRKLGQIGAKELARKVDAKLFNLEPEWQREKTRWTSQRKQLLINSMLRGMDISVLYLARSKGKTARFQDMVDGKQRTTAIREFLAGELAIPVEPWMNLAGKQAFFADLSEEQQGSFEEYSVNIVSLENATEEEVREMFLRLQQGVPLTKAEVRNSQLNDLVDFCRKTCTTHPVFERIAVYDNKKSPQTLVARMFALERAGHAVMLIEEGLRRIFADCRHMDPAARAAAGRTTAVLDRMERVLGIGAAANDLYGRLPFLVFPFAVSFYYLMMHLANPLAVHGHEVTLFNSFLDLDDRRRAALEQKSRTQDHAMLAYADSIKHNPFTRTAIELRHEFLVRHVSACVPQLRFRPPHRNRTPALVAG